MTPWARPFALSFALGACGVEKPPATPAVALPTPVADPPVDRVKALSVIDETSGDSVWLVHSRGVLERAWPPAGAPRNHRSIESSAGSDRMQPSRDGTRVAYVESQTLKIHDLRQGTDVDVARNEDQARLLVITDWSADGNALLYATTEHGEPSVDRFVWYDLRTRKRTPVAVPGEYAGLFPSGEILVRNHRGLDIVSSGHARVLVADGISSNQETISLDGTRLFTILWQDAQKNLQLASIDVRTGAIAPIGPPGRSAELQFPKPSPSGAKLACLAYDRVMYGSPRETLWIDGKRVGPTFDDLLTVDWIDDDTLVEVHTNELVVVSAKDASVKGRVAR